MTNQELLQIAMKQSAEDIGCKADDFLLSDNVTVPFHLGVNARKYLKKPITCNLVSYGNNVVAAVMDEVAGGVAEYIGRYEFYHYYQQNAQNLISYLYTSISTRSALFRQNN